MGGASRSSGGARGSLLRPSLLAQECWPTTYSFERSETGTLARAFHPAVEASCRLVGGANAISELSTGTARYYDSIAHEYANHVPDWHGAVRRQGRALHQQIVSALGSGPHAVLDCTCGVGTQAVGLATMGHSVVGTDLSAEAIREARRHADVFGVAAEFEVADVREIGAHLDRTFDVVLSIDNSLPHLLAADDLTAAARGMYRRLRPGGLLLISMRDYDRHLQSRPSATQPQVWQGPAGERVAFQRWDWLTDNIYRSTLIILDEDGSRWQARSHDGATYRAWTRSEVAAILEDAGFDDVEWHNGASASFHQPILSCRRPEAGA